MAGLMRDTGCYDPVIVMPETEAPVQSPCVGNCCLDEQLVCMGCFRTLEEIKEWGIVDNRRRLVILQNSTRRRQADQERT